MAKVPQTPLRAGVVGAGVFGGYHASKYAAHAGATLIGAYDPVLERAGALCETHGGRPFEALGDLIAACDVLTIASPAAFHHSAAKRALEAGKHVLVEKPLAATALGARQLTELAEANGLVLQVGHQERFVARAMGLFGDLPPVKALAAKRMGPPSPRNLDVSVTLDLMIHDIDLALALIGDAPVEVTAEMHADRGGLADHIYAEIAFSGGARAVFEASRVAPDRERVTRLDFDGDASVEIDFIAKTLSNPAGLALNRDFAADPIATDSLGAGVNAFIAAVRGEPAIGADARAGLHALETALAIDAAARSLSQA